MIPERPRRLLDPVYAAWLEATNPPLPAGSRPTLEEMRDGFRRQAAISNGELDAALVVEDIDLPGRDGRTVPVRVFRHRDAPGPRPCCVFLHGGGWVLGDLDTHAGVCNDIAVATGLQVVAVDYRLAPEHPYPAPLEDTVDVLRALVDEPDALGVDPARIVASGDSAGASLALAAALTLRGERAAPRALALVYPGIGADIDRPSFAENADVPGLTPELMRFFFVSYLGGETLPDPLAAPLTAPDLSGLPPLLISVAELDPLRDDGTDLAARLEGGATPVTLRVEPGLGHGYLWVRHRSPAAGAAFEALCAFLRDGAGGGAGGGAGDDASVE